MEALCTNKRVAELIEEARQHTRSEKKRLAMAMRERQLGALGMQTNDKGQVTASGTILQQMEDLGDETGLICVICREGYKFKPNMVIYLLSFSLHILELGVYGYSMYFRKLGIYFCLTTIYWHYVFYIVALNIRILYD